MTNPVKAFSAEEIIAAVRIRLVEQEEARTAADRDLAARIAALEARPVAKGDVGEPGAVGPPGEIGPPGPQGETGPAGPQGEVGALGLVPPQLAEQINTVMKMLQEAPPIAEIVRAAEPPRRVTGTMITRDGVLAVSYSDGTLERLGPVTGEQGPAGPAGPQGPSGRDGVDGAKGDEGRRGRDGASVTAITKSGNKTLYALSDGTLFAVANDDEKKRE